MARSTDGRQHWERAAGALGQTSIGSIAVATTTDRVIIYIGTSGGMLSGGAVKAQSQASDATLVSAGVHRYLMRQLNHRVYLSLTVKSYMQ
jgi:hypothetical protein